MEKLKKEFIEMLNNVGNDFSEETLTALFPIKGDKYNRELMVVGRALNGWGRREDNIWWKAKKEKPSTKTVEKIIKFSLEGDKKGECPMKWIVDNWELGDNSYHMKKSAFWRVIKVILSELEITSANDWSSYLVWSNLYKVACPEGGNPSTKLCNAQFENCKTILKEEIKFYKPKRILFLTGYNWFCDYENIGFKESKKLHSAVEWVGTFNKTKVVIAEHPQGKKESAYVKLVIKHFKQ